MIRIHQKLQKLQFCSFNTMKKIVEKMLIIFISNGPRITDLFCEHASDEQQSQLMNGDMNNVVIKTVISIFIIFRKTTLNACELINQKSNIFNSIQLFKKLCHRHNHQKKS